MSGPRPTLRCPCNGRHLVQTFHYDEPPEGETRFDLADGTYSRAYDRCTKCGHYFARHDIDISHLYERGYVDSTYGGVQGMRERLERILALPLERSDNAGRVACILDFAATHFACRQGPFRVLDVGAGIGIFPATMKAAGWTVVAVEPDPRTAQHLRESVGVEAFAEPLAFLDPARVGRFNAITFNKVLEHVDDPLALLAAARPLLSPGGFVYVEVPDAEAAARHGRGREEFFIEHVHVFSTISLTNLADRAHFVVILTECLEEPSGKFTLRAFLVEAPSGATNQM